MTFARGLAAAAMLLLASSAHAAPWEPKKKAARAMLDAAADAAEAGDFARSAALSLQSLTVEPSIFALWNAGQAFMDAGEWASAIEQYDRALADPHLPRKQRPRINARRSLARAFLDGAAVADAERWDDARAAYLAILDRDDLYPLDRQHAGTALEQLAQRRAAAEAAAAAATTPAPPTERPTAPPISTAPAPPTPEPIDTRPPPRRPSRWRDTPALAMLGTGTIGVGVGGWLVMHAEDLDDQADAPGTPEPRSALHDRADRFRTAGTIALAAGGALVVVGAIRLAIAPDAPRSTVATLQPTSGGALVVLGGRF